jgi:chromosome segregation ATPase
LLPIFRLPKVSPQLLRASEIALRTNLLQQRSVLDQQRNEEIEALQKGWEKEKLDHAQQIKDLMYEIKVQERKATEERVERTCAIRDLTEELEANKAEFEKLNAAHKRLKANEREVREDYQALTIEFDALKEDMRASEEELSSQVDALKQIIFQKEQQASSWEQKYNEKCEECRKYKDYDAWEEKLHLKHA